LVGRGEVFTLLLFYLVLSKTREAIVTNATTSAQDFLKVCNDTVTVYLNGFPEYVVIGEGCLTVPLLANNFTLLDNKVFFWNSTPITLMKEDNEGTRGLSVPPWVAPTALLLIRGLLSKRAAL